MATNREEQEADLDLLIAIGRVVTNSASLDESLRHLLGELIGSDQVWILLEGQPTEWLVSSTRAVLGELAYQRRWGREHHEKLLSLLNDADELRLRRNTVIHSTWTKEPYYGSTIPRPSNAPDDSRIYYFVRSRYRKESEERCLAVSDIESIASAIKGLERRLLHAYRAAVDDWLGNPLRH